jgi:haloalkane dehalogenase
MPESDISALDAQPRHTVAILDSEMAYVDTDPGADGDVVVFLHGNPTSSYLWRNIIPHVAPHARCLAPDLIGMGDSGPSGGKVGDGSYRYVDHRRYLDAWFDAVLPTQNVTVVIHDWGSALGFDWCSRHPDRAKGIAYMEAIVMPVSWDDWPEGARGVFEGFRSPAGEDMVLEKNVFVENVLPGSILRGLTDEEHAHYRKPFAEPGEVRRPTLTWPREIPLAGEPADVVQIVSDYGAWLAASDVPKLLVSATPGAILNGKQLELVRSWPNTTEVSVEGVHFVQEDSPHAIGEAIVDWYRAI